jgi:hypothetical protein
VRCVRDPQTRWEGAYQLQRSFEQLEWLEEQKKESEESQASDEDIASEGESETGDSASVEGEEPTTETSIKGAFVIDSETTDGGEYARLLTEAQKDELMKMLVDRPSTTDDGKEVRLSSGDKVLIDVVSNWGDHRFAKFLLDRLQASSTEPYETSQMMSTIAKVLSDEELNNIAEMYSNVSYGDDDKAVDADELEEPNEDEEEGSATDETESSEAPAKTEPESKSESEPVRVTYREFRSSLLSKFLNRTFVAVSIADAKNEESGSPKSR